MAMLTVKVPDQILMIHDSDLVNIHAHGGIQDYYDRKSKMVLKWNDTHQHL